MIKRLLPFYALLSWFTFATLPSISQQSGSLTALAQPAQQKQNGMSYAAWWPGEYSKPYADHSLANLANTGATWISLIVTQYQDSVYTTDIYAAPGTPTDADLVHAIAQAHRYGLKVMLKPHVDLANDPSHWRGQIGEYYSESDWAHWFSSYQKFINHYAELAQANHAEQFCAGTELSGTELREKNWRIIIAGIRQHYSGSLTYAANHGDENRLNWWDAVDIIGVDAYYPLTGKNDPTVDELKTAWQPIVTSLAALASARSKSIIFTEIGYRSQDGTNQHPWDWQIGGTIDLQEQRDAYQAAFESFYNQAWFSGFYWWSWDTNPTLGGPCNMDYTPYDKPAEQVVRAWYGARAAIRPVIPVPDPQRIYDVYTDALAPGWSDGSWDASVNLASSNPVYSGVAAISASAQPWGALSLHYPDLDTSPYYWLEFYLQEPSIEQAIRLFIDDEYTAAPVDICRYVDGAVQPNSWMHVRVPLLDLAAADRKIQNVVVKNYSDQPAQFSIDDMRFMGAQWTVYLPAIEPGQ